MPLFGATQEFDGVLMAVFVLGVEGEIVAATEFRRVSPSILPALLGPEDCRLIWDKSTSDCGVRKDSVSYHTV